MKNKRSARYEKQKKDFRELFCMRFKEAERKESMRKLIIGIRGQIERTVEEIESI